jgi:hypothetical protein
MKRLPRWGSALASKTVIQVRHLAVWRTNGDWGDDASQSKTRDETCAALLAMQRFVRPFD